MQLLADIVGCHVHKPDHAETTSLGAAVAAGIAVGFYDEASWFHVPASALNEVPAGTHSSVAPTTTTTTTFNPTIHRRERAKRLAAWQDAVERSFLLAAGSRPELPPRGLTQNRTHSSRSNLQQHAPNSPHV